MRLAAVMRLVVEEMQQQRHQRLLDLSRVAQRAIAHEPVEVGLAQPRDIGGDAGVLGLPRRPQLAEIVVEDAFEALRRITRAGEAAHPDPVADQDVVQRAVQRAEEGAAIGAVVFVGQPGRGIVEALVGPFVVGRQHVEMGFHARTSPSGLVTRSLHQNPPRQVSSVE